MTLDEVISEFDRGLRSMAGISRMSRPVPEPNALGQSEMSLPGIDEPALDEKERSHAAGLMRVNHVGEVCAQALYQAQKLATNSPQLKASFEHAAREEEDHLAWTSKRLRDLDSRPSLLNPLWYAGALAIGFAAGRLGDRASLGFMAETERQVEQHLDGHMKTLPQNDHASRAIVEQMRQDEAAHAAAAIGAGGGEVPFPVRALMRAASKIMTRTAYYI
ncbi:2-polyprenyl-3-methyl-6-methoxy-1,4-benzoquinone monooxygenase [Caballeronia sp. LP006]|jgi:ubiquinone biosynthesis monooxygenase Coq7|uniref:2-polyprenyl-3-methyl-6-methoxy-1,4-benzoquinone monooxygenase n=1 Tax=unclassified Caballeronia TaxID=2646786 RepID=UPI001FD3BEA4|nr:MULTISPECIES: 2-polyprenyl-3-methyl-6-methoxy-1,4-benzoquinone monooxygenase [unclassified Caballeronia]MDR5772598.1 2-polyprenyl-3-methyl-6-methoxy-1,4-benzoquinone monooxygenase [Caballeronia sp. LZ002]MDR5803970.1 2-polyprenyl-3-methyl-6-methoxy-1,4-benzoquinone monooxygenase [Caballeronia sp. LZ001]MDR5832196.1 2-polyprenyl-3-methyl-6-methoxy-1,4-benzoquinone monooxygenase [Caballeronia sp. LP006]MDR5848032.1 2-polyprenyl-3-methyl-6-methoxy-1,4-benzoquinone monooxygenase [Caballeronia sp